MRNSIVSVMESIEDFKDSPSKILRSLTYNSDYKDRSIRGSRGSIKNKNVEKKIHPTEQK